MASLPHPRKMLCAALGLGLALAIAAPVSFSGAATTERIVTDWHSGLAIGGFDPMTYFIDRTPKPGRDEYEFTFGGATWRFANEGNRAAFAADPQVYMPRFGGYDPVAIGRGVAAPGHPQIWLLDHGQLFLFFSADAREAFASDRDGALAVAEDNWPRVLRGLVQ